MEPSIAAVGAGAWGKNIVRTLHQMGALHSIVEPSPALRDAASAACPGVPTALTAHTVRQAPGTGARVAGAWAGPAFR